MDTGQERVMKRRILIVDDDQNFRYALSELIPWRENGFEVVDQAVHGQQALEMLKKSRYHVVITDMEMPITDGVELTRVINEQYPDTIVVALSAYDDFGFVKESMKFGAKDYILKQEFEPETALQLILELCAKTYQDEMEELSREQFNHTLYQYLKGALPLEKAEVIVQKFQNREPMLVFCVRCTESSGFTNHFEKEQEYRLLRCMKYDRENWFFILQLPVTNSRQTQLIWIQKILTGLKGCFAGKIYIGYSEEAGDILHLPRLFSQAETALEYARYFPETEKFSYLEISGKEKRRDRKFHISQLPEGSSMDELLMWFCETMREWFPEPEALDENILIFYREYIRKNGISVLENEIMQFYQQVRLEFTLQDKSDLLYHELEEIVQKQGSLQEVHHSSIRKALEYINEHYNEELTLAELAAYTGLSENYFSNLFKKETGKNLKTYLNYLRIHEAKKLLRNTNLKVYEIAGRVGFHNATYFTSTFRKITGESVTDFRNHL